MKFKLDTTLLAILSTLVLGLVLPISGQPAETLKLLTKVAVFVLFFGYGARLSAAESLAGLKNWKLHLAIAGTTFVVFPIISLLVLALPETLLSGPLKVGLVFLCLVPSTVQSSITFTSLAGGNVPAAMIAATASNVLGVVVTPLLVMALLSTSSSGASVGTDQLVEVLVQLLLPFVLGQLSRKVTASWVAQHLKQLRLLDQGVICLIVYSAFSELRSSGSWRALSFHDALIVVPVVFSLLGVMFWFTWHLAGWLKLPRQDQIAVMFCGTKKSLATGLPMASVLFGAATVSVLIIPLMLYHQSQLLASSVLATRLRSSAQS